MHLIPFTFSAGGSATVSRDLYGKGNGWLLLYKRLSESRFQWPRSPQEVCSLMPQQFRWLMEGLTTTPKKPVRPVEPPEYMG
ncbi:MAG: transposase [Lachnospiraceae bacterium]|nr:transposase [Lachnospiraceae bacterium]